MARKILRRRPAPRRDPGEPTLRAEPQPAQEPPVRHDPDEPLLRADPPRARGAIPHHDPDLRAPLDYAAVAGDDLSVSDILRGARERYGRSLDEVSRLLNIRKPYLEAIENQDYDRLPGMTYAVGFVRTYAEYLELDPNEMVQRFKDEEAGIGKKQNLVFPAPAPESRLPSAALLLVSLVGLGIAFGIWTLLSSSESDVPDLVPEVPERLSTLLPAGDGNSSSPSEASQAEPAPEPEPEPEPADQPAVAPASEATAEPGTDQTASSEVEVPAMADQAEPTSETTQPEIAATSVPEAPALPAAPAEDASLPEADAATAEVPETPSVAALPTVPADGDVPEAPAEATVPLAPVVAPVTSSEPEGEVYGAENTGSRITLRAIQDSWIQVRGEGGNQVLSRLLRAGESFRVPSTQGLVMVTGNAGGLQVVVDDQNLGTMGPVGKVRRDVALDPDLLLQGVGMQP